LQGFDAFPSAGFARQHGGPGDHVDVGVPGDDLADAGCMFEAHRDAEVERVFWDNAFLHERHQVLMRLLREVRHHGAFGFGVIVKQVDRAARRGDETDARSFRQTASVKGKRNLHHVVE